MQTKLSGLLLLVQLLLILACSPEGMKREYMQIGSIDSLLISQKERMFKCPDSVIVLLRKHQEHAVDSLSWYYWEVNIGQCHFFNNQVEEAYGCNSRVLNYCRHHESQLAIALVNAVAYNNRSVYLQAQNERDSALSYLEKAYCSIKNSECQKELPDICINAADVCRQLGKLPQACSWYRRALFAADSLNLDLTKHSIYLGLGQVYADLNNFEMARHYFSIAGTEFPPNSPYEKYSYYNSKGNSLYFEKKYSEALSCFREAYRTVRPFRQKSVEAIVEGNLAEIHLLLDELDSARYYLNRSASYFLQSLSADDGIRFYINGLYASLALEENDLPNAKRYLSQSYNWSRIGPSYLYLYHKRLKDYYKKMGDYNKALHYQELMQVYNDSLRNANSLNSIAEVELRYQQDTTLLKRDILIADSRSQVSRLETILAIGVALFILLVSSLAVGYSYLRRRNERQRQRQLTLVTRLRMENVRNRFSPHFVFNVLNVVVSSLRQVANADINPLKLLVQVLRSNLMVCDKIAVSLTEEVSLVKDFVDLRSTMSESVPVVEWEVADDVDWELLLPTMIIQIPVENALKHAFLPGEMNGAFIRISISRIENAYHQIIIEDNGVGYMPQQQSLGENSTGNGIPILYRTVQLLNRSDAPRKLTFEISDRSLISGGSECGTRVMILIPNHFNYDL